MSLLLRAEPGDLQLAAQTPAHIGTYGWPGWCQLRPISGSELAVDLVPDRLGAAGSGSVASVAAHPQAQDSGGPPMSAGASLCGGVRLVAAYLAALPRQVDHSSAGCAS